MVPRHLGTHEPLTGFNFAKVFSVWLNSSWVCICYHVFSVDHGSSKKKKTTKQKSTKIPQGL